MVVGRLLIVLMMGCRLQFCHICSSESCRSSILWRKERNGDTEATWDSPISASERKRSWFYSTLCCVFHTLDLREPEIWWKVGNLVLFQRFVLQALLKKSLIFSPLQRENTHLSKCLHFTGLQSKWKDCFAEAVLSVRCYKLSPFPSFPSILGGSPESWHLVWEVKQTLVNLHISGPMTRSWIFHARINLRPPPVFFNNLWCNSGGKGRTRAEWNK